MAMALLVSAIGVLTLRDTSIVSAAASFLSSVAHDTTLTGNGTTTAPLGVANDGVGNSQLSNGAVTAPKIATGQVVRSLNGLTDHVILGAGSNISITQSGNTLTISSMLGLTSVAHDSTLQGDGTSGLPLGIANLGVGTNQLANSAITAQKIAPGQVVTSINSLRNNVTLAAGSNVTITPNGNTLTIASNTSQQPSINPLRVATLRWYEGNATGAGLSFGQPAVALAFDGAHMWTTVGNSLIKFRPSDIAILGTFSTQAGGTAGPLTFDGANIWVGISDNPLLLKFRASDGALIGTFSLSGIAQELAFDGFHIWATSGTKLLKLRPSDGVTVDIVDFGSPAQGLAIGDSWVWVTLSNGTVMSVCRCGSDEMAGPYNVGINPKGIAFDGVNMWIANSGQLSVTKLRGSDGAFLGSFAECSNCGNPLQVAFDGAQMWVTTSTGHLKRYRISDGREVGNHFIPSANLRAIAFDGANIWVAHSSGVTKL
jgi:hypothetical protein